jgi:hypothetical protein
MAVVALIIQTVLHGVLDIKKFCPWIDLVYARESSTKQVSLVLTVRSAEVVAPKKDEVTNGPLLVIDLVRFGSGHAAVVTPT